MTLEEYILQLAVAKKQTDDAIQSQHIPLTQISNSKTKTNHNDHHDQSQSIKKAVHMHKRKLYEFLPEMSSNRPFISHQNAWEQVTDLNAQYIKKVTSSTTSDTSTKLSNPDNNITSDNREWVNHPQHYKPGTYETWKIINEYGLDKDFYLATALRYILRAGKKHEDKFAEDLRKAIWYLNQRANMHEDSQKD